jgi:hypothetical protein
MKKARHLLRCRAKTRNPDTRFGAGKNEKARHPLGAGKNEKARHLAVPGLCLQGR